MKVLSDFQIEEKVYPFREGKTRVFGYRTFGDNSVIVIVAYYTDGLTKGTYGGHVFFQRENLKEVIQAIEDWFNPDLKITVPSINVTDNDDIFGVSFGYPDRFDVRPVLMLSTNIQSEIDGSEALGWDLVTDIDTGPKLIAELKKVDTMLNNANQ
jgi:hypothetical protein